jgi:hypothetical protein
MVSRRDGNLVVASLARQRNSFLPVTGSGRQRADTWRRKCRAGDFCNRQRVAKTHQNVNAD